jgi:phage terminase small subunit
MGKKRNTGAPAATKAQLKFCEQYALNGNGAQAYKVAFPKSAKWTAASRARRASKLLKSAHIESRVKDLQAKVVRQAEKLFEITADKVLQEMAAIGFSNMGHYLRFTTSGEPLVKLDDLSPMQMAAVSEVVVEDFVEGRGEDARDVRRVKFKLHDKRAALKDIGQHLGIFKLPIGGDVPAGGVVLVPMSDADAAL